MQRCTPDRSFTGQNQDTVQGSTAGLYDFIFREHAQYGRWISPDPGGLKAVDITNPQTWNRYAYVQNYPTGLVDPLGLDDNNRCLLDGVQMRCSMIAGLVSAGAASECGTFLTPPCPGFATIAINGNIVDVPIQVSQNNGGFGGCGQVSDTNIFCVSFAPQNTASAANNSSWGWNFTEAFLGGLVSSAGWKAVYHSTVDQGGCNNLMFSTFADVFNPLPSRRGRCQRRC